MDLKKKLDKILLINSATINLLKKHDLLEILVKKELLFQEIKDIKVTNEEINQIELNFIKEKNLETTIDLNEWLEDQNIIKKDFIHELTQPLRLAKYCDLE